MPKLQPVPWKTFEKFLLRSGCIFKRQAGSHRVYWKAGIHRPIIVQAKGKVPVFIIQNNLRTLGIDRADYLGAIGSF
jgi:predicted RNA binding protein YcfA (HicA-like mRNA interferase family)